MSAGSPLPDLCRRYLRPPQLPPPAVSPLLPLPYPPEPAAEFDRRAATVSPPPATLVPVAATPTFAAIPLPWITQNHSYIRLAGRIPQSVTNNTAASRRICCHRRRSSAPSFAWYHRHRGLLGGSSRPITHDSRSASFSRHTSPACTCCGQGSQDRPVRTLTSGTHAGCHSHRPRPPAAVFGASPRAPLKSTFVLLPQL